MRKLNQEFLTKIYDICAKSEDVKLVGPDYYEDFLKIPEKGMEALIFHILSDRADSFNRKILNNYWECEQDIYDEITFYLELIARGILGFRESDFKLTFSKPVGPLPDPDQERMIDLKIKTSIPLMEKALRSMLQGKDEKEDKSV